MTLEKNSASTRKFPSRRGRRKKSPCRFPSAGAGVHHCEVRLPQDSLEYDNHFLLTLSVLEKEEVLIVTDGADERRRRRVFPESRAESVRKRRRLAAAARHCLQRTFLHAPRRRAKSFSHARSIASAAMKPTRSPNFYSAAADWFIFSTAPPMPKISPRSKKSSARTRCPCVCPDRKSPRMFCPARNRSCAAISNRLT